MTRVTAGEWTGGSVKEATGRRELEALTKALMVEHGASKRIVGRVAKRFVSATTRSDVYRLLGLFGYRWRDGRWRIDRMKKAG